MEIAGKMCKVCGSPVVLVTEGKVCPQCGAVVHMECEPGVVCRLCGLPFEIFTPGKIHPRSQAVVPSALRPSSSGGPVFVVGLVLILAFVLMLLLFITHGHAF